MFAFALVFTVFLHFSAALECPELAKPGPSIGSLVGTWYLVNKGNPNTANTESCGKLSISLVESGKYSIKREGKFGGIDQSFEGFLVMSSDNTKLIVIDQSGSPGIVHFYFIYADNGSLVLYQCENQVIPYVFVKDSQSTSQALTGLKAVTDFGYKNGLYNVIQLNC